jgi:hypothetical protein
MPAGLSRSHLPDATVSQPLFNWDRAVAERGLVGRQTFAMTRGEPGPSPNAWTCLWCVVRSRWDSDEPWRFRPFELAF